MLKNFCSFLAGAGVLGDTVIPLIAPAEQLGWWRWRIPIVFCAVIALIALAVQLILQSREEKEERRQREESGKRFEELAELLQPRAKQGGQVATAAAATLRDKVFQLGHDLFSFLREVGPMPALPVDHLKDDRQWLDAVTEARMPHWEKIHYGYLRRFKQRTIDLFYELAENHIAVPEIRQWEIDPPQSVNMDTVRKIAEVLFLVAARMDIADASRGT